LDPDHRQQHLHEARGAGAPERVPDGGKPLQPRWRAASRTWPIPTMGDPLCPGLPVCGRQSSRQASRDVPAVQSGTSTRTWPSATPCAKPPPCAGRASAQPSRACRRVALPTQCARGVSAAASPAPEPRSWNSSPAAAARCRPWAARSPCRTLRRGWRRAPRSSRRARCG